MSTSKKELEELFKSELYLYFHNDSLSPERTKRECDFIEKHCEISPGAKVLDLACGHGRHANYLAARGYEVCGIDLNQPFIEMARKDAKDQKLTVDYRIQDILEMDFDSEFEAAICLFNTL